MSFEDNLKESLKGFLVDRGVDAVEVISFRDDTEAGGYCESCYYEYAVVRIVYIDSKNQSREFTYSDGFSDLIRELA